MLDFIGEIIVEVIAEFFVESFVGLSETFVPESRLGRRIRTAVKVIVVLLSTVIVFLGMIGICILIEDGITRPLGWVFIAIAAAYLIAAVVMWCRHDTKGRRRND